jgi:sulfite reductase (ferredoxin)
VPHFHLILGGQWDKNAANYGQSLGAVPSKRVPEVVERLIDLYMTGRQPGEGFRDYVTRVGKKDIKERIKDLTVVPLYEEDRSFYSDWADAREFTIGDIGVGECAGEVVTLTDFGVAAAETLHFEAQVLLDESPLNGNVKKAADTALQAMLSAAQALIKMQNIDVTDDPDQIVAEFRTRFYDTRLFFDPFAQGKFASFFFNAYEKRHQPVDFDKTRQLIEESRLFIEAAHECNSRMLAAGITNPLSFNRWVLEKDAQPVPA